MAPGGGGAGLSSGAMKLVEQLKKRLEASQASESLNPVVWTCLYPHALLWTRWCGPLPSY